MIRILPVVCAALLLAASPLAAADLAVTVAPSAPSVELGQRLDVQVKVANAGTDPVQASEAVEDILSVSLEIAYAGRVFEYMKIAPAYFEFLQGKDIQPYHKTVVLEPGEAKETTLSILLPEAGSYEVRAVYRGAGEAIRSAWAPVEVKPKGESKRLLVRMKTNQGAVVLAFHADKALGTVMNFLDLADKEFYDGVGFHRVIKGFMSQGGDPEGTGAGGPGYSIPQEFNDLHHDPGVLSMARTSRHVDTAGSQFFLCVKMDPKTQRLLDRQYTVFGYTVEGMETVTKINEVPVDAQTRPTSPVTMQEVRVVAE